ncbi:MAG: hypothetical protein OIN84_04395 [Candidatus Methanoperedens sp.]|nr:hypothetical protein [Candidatus Methanoperedens sp.]
MNIVKPSGIADETWTKLDAALRQEVTAHADDRLHQIPVMLVLNTSGQPPTPKETRSREDRVRQAQENQASFERETADLVQTLHRLNVSNLQLLWLNRTISAEMTIPALNEIGQREEIRQITLVTKQNVLLTPNGQ